MFDQTNAFNDANRRAVGLIGDSRSMTFEKVEEAARNLIMMGVNGSTLFAADTGVNCMTQLCHALAVRGGWWHNPANGEPLPARNVGEMISLMHSELSEALEAHRKSLNDSHITHRKGVEVELADLLIRVFDFAGAHGLDLGGAIVEKLHYNANRADHTLEARAAANGKAY